MNERLEKLFGEALDKAVPETWTKLDSEQLDRLMKKFTEMVVIECANQVCNTDLEGVEGGDSEVLYAAAAQVKEHFGIGTK